jgi:fibronectin type 3 domain-containing protein
LKEEFAQVTSAPVSRIEFADRVDLNTLNRELHYQIMAIDQSQNHSGLSDILTLKVPDKIKPVAPFFYPVEASEEGVKLSWTRSSSDDVVRYDVYKKGLSSQQWDKIAEVLHGTDTAYVYQDKDGDEGVKAVYTVFAIDEGGLQSDPATPVVGAKIPDPVKPPVVVLKPVIAREEKQIVLKWNYDQAGVAKYQIYRAKEGEPLKLYSTQDASTQEFIDRQLIINTVYNYHVVAMFRSGARSEFGERVVVNY